jgi:hypothetical protein
MHAVRHEIVTQCASEWKNKKREKKRAQAGSNSRQQKNSLLGERHISASCYAVTPTGSDYFTPEIDYLTSRHPFPSPRSQTVYHIANTRDPLPVYSSAHARCRRRVAPSCAASSSRLSSTFGTGIAGVLLLCVVRAEPKSI